MALTMGSMAAALATTRPEPRPLTNTDGIGLRLAQDPMVETALFFETETMAVRVYRQGSNYLMNLYNKTTDAVEARGIPARIIPSSRDQIVYRADRGEAERFARINVLNETELEIIAADGTLVLKEPGFNAVVGVPDGSTDFQGNSVAPGTGAIVLSAEAARLRSHPRLGSDILGAASRREIVDVLDRVGNPDDGFIWYQVIYDGVTGWVRGDLLQPLR
ncbi:SH3 domain-containing protein [Nodosilinea sp. P-1105]|uniref:SH3 domain-containing protein n=1 Tax=Nodosilinea sp. P-1105 TaxID=2546229 RepID=UPI00146CC376|nr:SH3 domain-containing protein [Nodosilinea sp. P-1105]